MSHQKSNLERSKHQLLGLSQHITQLGQTDFFWIVSFRATRVDYNLVNEAQIDVHNPRVSQFKPRHVKVCRKVSVVYSFIALLHGIVSQ